MPQLLTLLQTVIREAQAARGDSGNGARSRLLALGYQAQALADTLQPTTTTKEG